MPEMTEPIINIPPEAADARERRRMYVAIAVLVVAFLLVVAFRRDIRVRWWEHRLMHAHDLQTRTLYLRLLTTEPVRAAPVAERLIGSADPALRSFGVTLGLRVPGSRGDALLQRVLDDLDPAVRRGAIQGFSRRASPAVLPTLRRLIDAIGATDDPADPGVDAALWATYSLGFAADPAAAEALRTLAVHHPHAGVRAQAIASLGQWSDAATIAALTECLRDTAVFDHPIPAEVAALETLEQAAPQLAGQAEMPHALATTNAERARQVLAGLAAD